MVPVPDPLDDALVLGAPCDQAFLVVHGMGGCKEEAAPFADRAQGHGWQVVSVDLPEGFLPWDCVPFIDDVYRSVAGRWRRIALRATSIGAWFSLHALADRPLAGALLQSPVVDMVPLIEGMMAAVGVDRPALEAVGELPGPGGDVLSWRYLRWAEEHRDTPWNVPTSIVLGDRDEVVSRESVEDFATAAGANLTLLDGGAHWLHHPDELHAIARWEEGVLAQA